MMADKTLYIKKDRKIFSSDIRSEFRKNFDVRQKYKNLFKKNIPSVSFRKLLEKGPNLYRSFITSSAPYNYFKLPGEQNSYLVCYNGGPKIYTYAEKNKLNEELDKKDIIYGEQKDCGCFSKIYVPKLRRCLSNLENYRTNFNYFKAARPNTVKNEYFVNEGINNNKVRNVFTPKPIKIKNRQFQNNSCFNKCIICENDNYNNYSTNYSKKFRINFENNKDDSEQNKIIKRNSYNNLIYSVSQRVDRKFHKRQIFDNCKPFLQELL